MFLEDCKYVVKEKKVPQYIIDDIDISSDSYKENSGEESFEENNSDEEISDEKELKNTNMTKIFISFFCILKIVSKYYKKHKEKLQKEACERYQNLIEIRIFLKKKKRRKLSV